MGHHDSTAVVSLERYVLTCHQWIDRCAPLVGIGLLHTAKVPLSPRAPTGSIGPFFARSRSQGLIRAAGLGFLKLIAIANIWEEDRNSVGNRLAHGRCRSRSGELCRWPTDRPTDPPTEPNRTDRILVRCLSASFGMRYRSGSLGPEADRGVGHPDSRDPHVRPAWHVGGTILDAREI